MDSSYATYSPPRAAARKRGGIHSPRAGVSGITDPAARVLARFRAAGERVWCHPVGGYLLFVPAVATCGGSHPVTSRPCPAGECLFLAEVNNFDPRDTAVVAAFVTADEDALLARVRRRVFLVRDSWELRAGGCGTATEAIAASPTIPAWRVALAASRRPAFAARVLARCGAAERAAADAAMRWSAAARPATFPELLREVPLLGASREVDLALIPMLVTRRSARGIRDALVVQARLPQPHCAYSFASRLGEVHARSVRRRSALRLLFAAFCVSGLRLRPGALLLDLHLPARWWVDAARAGVALPDPDDRGGGVAPVHDLEKNLARRLLLEDLKE